tara:strand:- start:4067 stop:4279 length:213 start_codon:yes stop_codon:yes gene_type:complete
MSSNDMTTSTGDNVVYVNGEEFRPSMLEERLLEKFTEIEQRINQVEVVMARLIHTLRDGNVIRIEVEEEQ